MMRETKSISDVPQAVLDVELVQRQSMYGYQGAGPVPFRRITVAQPRLIAAAKRMLERGEVVVEHLAGWQYRAYESNVDFEIRYGAGLFFISLFLSVPTSYMKLYRYCIILK